MIGEFRLGRGKKGMGCRRGVSGHPDTWKPGAAKGGFIAKAPFARLRKMPGRHAASVSRRS